MGFFSNRTPNTSDRLANGKAASPRFSTIEVFTPSIPAGRGFVGRETELEDLCLQGLNVPGTQVIVWGESGAGKSSLVNKALEDTERTAVKTACTPDSTYEKILESAFSGTGAFYVAEASTHEDMTVAGAISLGGELIGAKTEISTQYGTGSGATRQPIARPQVSPQRLVHELGVRNLSWVIEDFHKADNEVRQRLSHDLKIFSDEGVRYPDTRVIILGVSESVDDLMQASTNLTNRAIDIPVPPLGNNDLGKILEAGENLLNLNFSIIRGRLLSTSVGTASITHALALSCCNQQGVRETGEDTVQFTVDDFKLAVQSYARTRSSSLRSRFRNALKVHRKRKYENTGIILQALAQLPEDGGTVGEILDVIRRSEPSYPSGNATTYIRSLQSEERGALVRKTSSGKFRFDEPLQHAFAKSYFGIYMSGHENGDQHQDGSDWEQAISDSHTTQASSLRAEIEAAGSEFDEQDAAIQN